MKKFAPLFGILILIVAFVMKNPSIKEKVLPNSNNPQQNDAQSQSANGNQTTTLTVEPCDFKGERQNNATVDVGFGDRKYFAHTNEHGQLIKVEAAEIIAQKGSETPTGKRYCKDEARVKGTERHDLDQGHAIADSLGGVSNAYNITPQKDELNRHGKQAEMEKEIRHALRQHQKVTDFIYNIVYPNTNTQTPSSYNGSYKINGEGHTFNFENK